MKKIRFISLLLVVILLVAAGCTGTNAENNSQNNDALLTKFPFNLIFKAFRQHFPISYGSDTDTAFLFFCYCVWG